MVKPSSASSPAVRIQCAYCQGRGRDRFGVMSPLSTCPACGGQGCHDLTPPLIDCVYCHRTGVSPTGTRNPCLACGGKGMMPQEGRTAPCPHCGGSGANQVTGLYCHSCHGSGLVKLLTMN